MGDLLHALSVAKPLVKKEPGTEQKRGGANAETLLTSKEPDILAPMGGKHVEQANALALGISVGTV